LKKYWKQVLSRWENSQPDSLSCGRFNNTLQLKVFSWPTNHPFRLNSFECNCTTCGGFWVNSDFHLHTSTGLVYPFPNSVTTPRLFPEVFFKSCWNFRFSFSTPWTGYFQFGIQLARAQFYGQFCRQRQPGTLESATPDSDVHEVGSLAFLELKPAWQGRFWLPVVHLYLLAYTKEYREQW